jgi:hypothetical protein
LEREITKKSAKIIEIKGMLGGTGPGNPGIGGGAMRPLDIQEPIGYYITLTGLVR